MRTVAAVSKLAEAHGYTLAVKEPSGALYGAALYRYTLRRGAFLPAFKGRSLADVEAWLAARHQPGREG
jgi:hypothetical protein